MVPSLERGISISSSFNYDKMFDSSPGKEQEQSNCVETENGVSHLATTPETQAEDGIAGSSVETSRPMTSRLISRRREKQQSGDLLSQN